MTISDISRQLRLLLTNAPEAPSITSFLQAVDDFVVECSAGDTCGPALQLEEELQAVYHEVIDHSVLSQLKMFLS